MSEIYVKCKPEEADRAVLGKIKFEPPKDKGCIESMWKTRQLFPNLTVGSLIACDATFEKRLLPPEGGPWELKYGKDCSGEKPSGTMFWGYEQVWELASPGIWAKAPDLVYAIPLPSTQEQSDVQRESVEEAKEVGLPSSGASNERVQFLREWGEGSFGAWFKLDSSVKCDLVVLCRNNGFGLRPIRVSLSHQVYKKDILADYKENPDTLWYSILPASCAIDIAVCGSETKQAEPQEQPLSPTKQESPGEGYRWATDEELSKLPDNAEIFHGGQWVVTESPGKDMLCTGIRYRIPISTQEPTVEKKMPTEEQMMEGFIRYFGSYSLGPEGRFVDHEIQRRYYSWKRACEWCSNFNPLSVSKEGGEA